MDELKVEVEVEYDHYDHDMMMSVSGKSIDFESIYQFDPTCHYESLDAYAEHSIHGNSPYLVTNSLVILGFNPDEYLEMYSGISFDLGALTPKMFDRPNERMLLVILHYLFIILFKEEFHSLIYDCWPFLDTKEKNCYKRVVHQCMLQLIDQQIVMKEQYTASLLTKAQGIDIWLLLRTITDHCLTKLINSHDQEHQNHELILQTPEGYTLNERDQLLIFIDNEVTTIKTMILNHNNVSREYSIYAQELEQRLLNAEELIHQMTTTIYHEHIHDEHHIYADYGNHKRTHMIHKITTLIDLIAGFVDSPLISTLYKHISDDQLYLQQLQQKEIRQKMSKDDWEACIYTSMGKLNTLLQEIVTLV